MTRLRQLWLVTALVSVAALAGGYFLLVSPKANEAAEIREAADTQVAANRKLSNDIAQLKQQAKDLPKKQAELAQFARQIPSNPALPQLIRSLTDAADNAGVQLASVAPGDPQLAAPAAAVAGTAAPAAPAQALAHIPVNLQVSGTYSALTQFFSEIESLPRAFLVSGVTVAPGQATAGPARSGSAPAGGTSGTAAWTGDLTATLVGRLFMTTTAQAAAAPTGEKESS